MSFQNIDIGSLDVFSPILGGGLLFPKGFWEPGSLSAHKGHFGQGSTLTPFSASLVAGPSATSPFSVFTSGIDIHLGATFQTGYHQTIGQEMVTGSGLSSFSVSNSLDAIVNSNVSAVSNSLISGLSNKLIAPINIISAVTTAVNGTMTLTGVGDVAEAINSKKGFDISHPTKEGWRLSHICVEGPTADVYTRGKLKGTNIIKLPKYWKGLVDPDTITVTITPIGQYQELFVEKINGCEEIIVKSNAANSINCHYYIMAERIDTEKNITEYKGTWDDYPGDNSTRSIVGKDYDVR
jgi:hypothetical protein